ncbi:MAG: Protein RecA [Candidatus Gottesmanbacteria bacterium GW2011_GWB1_49_7]|uniref:Protein RecA n=1 Tax=Candidatus Gottesmanbacteria bacterium GW2011_GWB1_49_7 TaxID=1618448 RepID=A0A0G1YDP6_9BACT|nr:MAG: Protein RecA [Candidatus Gottesmanbacteria bacterium GW2011_GWB1_49_7]
MPPRKKSKKEEDISADETSETMTEDSQTAHQETARPAADKSARLAKVMNELQKTYGAAIITTADKSHSYTERWLTGSLTLDYLLGGGLPRAKGVQFKGFDHSGKTTLLTILASSVISQGGNVAWLKAEDLDRMWARHIGLPIPPNEAETGNPDLLDQIIQITGGNFIDPHRFLIIEGQTGEEVLESAARVIRTGALDLLVIDSITAITPRQILDKSLDKSEMRAMKPGLYARFVDRLYSAMGMYFNPATGEVDTGATAMRNPFSVVWTNQMRDKIGTIPLPPDAGGGWALKYFKRADVQFKSKYVADDKTGLVFGTEVTMSTPNCQIAPPGRCGTFLLYTENYEGHKKGEIDRERELIDLAVQMGVLQIMGSWFKIGERKFHGKKGLSEALHEDVILRNKLEAEIRGKF